MFFCFQFTFFQCLISFLLLQLFPFMILDGLAVGLVVGGSLVVGLADGGGLGM